MINPDQLWWEKHEAQLEMERAERALREAKIVYQRARKIFEAKREAFIEAIEARPRINGLPQHRGEGL